MPKTPLLHQNSNYCHGRNKGAEGQFWAGKLLTERVWGMPQTEPGSGDTA